LVIGCKAVIKPNEVQANYNKIKPVHLNLSPPKPSPYIKPLLRIPKESLSYSLDADSPGKESLALIIVYEINKSADTEPLESPISIIKKPSNGNLAIREYQRSNKNLNNYDKRLTPQRPPSVIYVYQSGSNNQVRKKHEDFRRYGVYYTAESKLIFTDEFVLDILVGKGKSQLERFLVTL